MTFKLNLTPNAQFKNPNPIAQRFFKDAEFRSNWIEWLRVKETLAELKRLA